MRNSERSVNSVENSVSVGRSLVLLVVKLIDFDFASLIGWFESDWGLEISGIPHLLGHGDVQLLEFGLQSEDVVDLGN